MALTVYWTDFAKNALKDIFDYHNKKVSLKIARQIAKQIVEKANIVGSFCEIGAIEELLKERPQHFRYILSKNYKIIYWVEIVDVFDTRQNPKKIIRNK